jgi:hypothetical protein
MSLALLWEETDSAAVDTFSHQVCGEGLLFTAIFLNNHLHLAQTNNVVQPKMINTNFMAFARTAAIRLFNTDNVDIDALRVGGHGVACFVRKKSVVYFVGSASTVIYGVKYTPCIVYIFISFCFVTIQKHRNLKFSLFG